MGMQLYYFNDEKQPLNVRVRKTGGEPWEYSYTMIMPQQGRLFTFDAPENTVPFVKRWSDWTVMISYIPSDRAGADDKQESTDT
jgi:hypothetical protein